MTDAVTINLAIISGFTGIAAVASTSQKYINTIFRLSKFYPMQLAASFLGFAWYFAGILITTAFDFRPTEDHLVFYKATFLFGAISLLLGPFLLLPPTRPKVLQKESFWKKLAQTAQTEKARNLFLYVFYVISVLQIAVISSLVLVLAEVVGDFRLIVGIVVGYGFLMVFYLVIFYSVMAKKQVVIGGVDLRRQIYQNIKLPRSPWSSACRSAFKRGDPKATVNILKHKHYTNSYLFFSVIMLILILALLVSLIVVADSTIWDKLSGFGKFITVFFYIADLGLVFSLSSFILNVALKPIDEGEMVDEATGEVYSLDAIRGFSISRRLDRTLLGCWIHPMEPVKHLIFDSLRHCIESCPSTAGHLQTHHCPIWKGVIHQFNDSMFMYHICSGLGYDNTADLNHIDWEGVLDLKQPSSDPENQCGGIFVFGLFSHLQKQAFTVLGLVDSDDSDDSNESLKKSAQILPVDALHEFSLNSRINWKRIWSTFSDRDKAKPDKPLWYESVSFARNVVTRWYFSQQLAQKCEKIPLTKRSIQIFETLPTFKEYPDQSESEYVVPVPVAPPKPPKAVLFGRRGRPELPKLIPRQIFHSSVARQPDLLESIKKPSGLKKVKKYTKTKTTEAKDTTSQILGSLQTRLSSISAQEEEESESDDETWSEGEPVQITQPEPEPERFVDYSTSAVDFGSLLQQEFPVSSPSHDIHYGMSEQFAVGGALEPSEVPSLASELILPKGPPPPLDDEPVPIAPPAPQPPMPVFAPTVPASVPAPRPTAPPPAPTYSGPPPAPPPGAIHRGGVPPPTGGPPGPPGPPIPPPSGTGAGAQPPGGIPPPQKPVPSPKRSAIPMNIPVQTPIESPLPPSPLVQPRESEKIAQEIIAPLEEFKSIQSSSLSSRVVQIDDGEDFDDDEDEYVPDVDVNQLIQPQFDELSVSEYPHTRGEADAILAPPQEKELAAESLSRRRKMSEAPQKKPRRHVQRQSQKKLYDPSLSQTVSAEPFPDFAAAATTSSSQRPFDGFTFHPSITSLDSSVFLPPSAPAPIVLPTPVQEFPVAKPRPSEPSALTTVEIKNSINPNAPMFDSKDMLLNATLAHFHSFPSTLQTSLASMLGQVSRFVYTPGEITIYNSLPQTDSEYLRLERNGKTDILPYREKQFFNQNAPVNPYSSVQAIAESFTFARDSCSKATPDPHTLTFMTNPLTSNISIQHTGPHQISISSSLDSNKRVYSTYSAIPLKTSYYSPKVVGEASSSSPDSLTITSDTFISGEIPSLSYSFGFAVTIDQSPAIQSNLQLVVGLSSMNSSGQTPNKFFTTRVGSQDFAACYNHLGSVVIRGVGTPLGPQLVVGSRVECRFDPIFSTVSFVVDGVDLGSVYRFPKEIECVYPVLSISNDTKITVESLPPQKCNTHCLSLDNLEQDGKALKKARKDFSSNIFTCPLVQHTTLSHLPVYILLDTPISGYENIISTPGFASLSVQPIFDEKKTPKKFKKMFSIAPTQSTTVPGYLFTILIGHFDHAFNHWFLPCVDYTCLGNPQSNAIHLACLDFPTYCNNVFFKICLTDPSLSTIVKMKTLPASSSSVLKAAGFATGLFIVSVARALGQLVQGDRTGLDTILDTWPSTDSIEKVGYSLDRNLGPEFIQIPSDVFVQLGIIKSENDTALNLGSLMKNQQKPTEIYVNGLELASHLQPGIFVYLRSIIHHVVEVLGYEGQALSFT